MTAKPLLGYVDDHLDDCWGMVLPQMSRRWWLLIFSVLKQHENKKELAGRTKTNNIK